MMPLFTTSRFLSSSHSATVREIADLSGDCRGFSGEIADLSGEIADLSDEIADLSGEIEDLSGESRGFSGTSISIVVDCRVGWLDVSEYTSRNVGPPPSLGLI